jgi:hypothetical protein
MSSASRKVRGSGTAVEALPFGNGIISCAVKSVSGDANERRPDQRGNE